MSYLRVKRTDRPPMSTAFSFLRTVHPPGSATFTRLRLRLRLHLSWRHFAPRRPSNRVGEAVFNGISPNESVCSTSSL